MSDSPAWQVSFLHAEKLRARLLRWQEEAVALGIGEDFRKTIAAMNQALHSDPIHWGDPVHSAKHARYTLYQRAISPLIVSYAVHVESRNV
jgi:hypothetical protein